MLAGMRMSIQAELDVFFAHLQDRSQLLRTVSEQAFAQARAKLSLTAIPSLNDWLVARAEPVWFRSARSSCFRFSFSQSIPIRFLPRKHPLQ